MTNLTEKLQEMYDQHKIITCCCESYRSYIEGRDIYLDVCIDKQWSSIIPLEEHKQYRYYSHTYSPHCLSVHFPDYYKEQFGDQAPFSWVKSRLLVVPERKKIHTDNTLWWKR